MQQCRSRYSPKTHQPAWGTLKLYESGEMCSTHLVLQVLAHGFNLSVLIPCLLSRFLCSNNVFSDGPIAIGQIRRDVHVTPCITPLLVAFGYEKQLANSTGCGSDTPPSNKELEPLVMGRHLPSPVSFFLHFIFSKALDLFANTELRCAPCSCFARSAPT